MIVLLMILILFGLLFITPVGAQVIYSADGARISVRAGPLSIPVYPRPEKSEKQLAKEAKKKAEKETGKKSSGASSGQKTGQKKQTEKSEQPLGGKIEFFKELLGIGLNALACIKRKLIMKDLVLYLTVGGKGDDAAGAALLYGRAWAAVGMLTPVLENTFQIRNRDIQVGIDFMAEDNLIYAEACILFRVGDILWIAVYHGVRALRVLLKQKRKGRMKNGTSNQ